MGKTTRGNYRDTILDNVKDIPGHPIHMGIPMDAHHLLSCEGVKQAGPKIVELIEYTDYDINHLRNLVLLPSTLQAACHLKVQLHRGNHTAACKDADSDHEDSYHDLVTKFVKEIKDELKDNCSGKNKDQRLVIDQLDEISADILHLIAKKPKKARLTILYDHFNKDNEAGCCNATSVTIAKDNIEPCSLNRNHYGKTNGYKRKLQNIHYKNGQYTLKIGE